MNLESAIALFDSHRAWFIDRRIGAMDPGPYLDARLATPFALHQLKGRKSPVDAGILTQKVAQLDSRRGSTGGPSC